MHLRGGILLDELVSIDVIQRHRKWIEKLSPDYRGLQDRYSLYVIEHQNESPNTMFWQMRIICQELQRLNSVTKALHVMHWR